MSSSVRLPACSPDSITATYEHDSPPPKLRKRRRPAPNRSDLVRSPQAAPAPAAGAEVSVCDTNPPPAKRSLLGPGPPEFLLELPETATVEEQGIANAKLTLRAAKVLPKTTSPLSGVAGVARRSPPAAFRQEDVKAVMKEDISGEFVLVPWTARRPVAHRQHTMV